MCSFFNKYAETAIHAKNLIIGMDIRLEKVADGRSSPPFGEFSDDLAAIINGYWAVLERGVQVDGTEIRPLNESEIRQHCHQSRQLGLRTVVVVATARIVREEIAGREVIDCSILLSKNDGTVLSVQEALETLVRTFSSGATNWMRGAAVLCSHDPAVKGRNVMVCDVGGTTTDVGGVRISFLMAHVENIGLGLGPDTRGAEIVSRGVLFGGDTVPASDLTIAKMADENAKLDKTCLE
ncbi:uncharacterized protein OGAPODRAFT_10107 [Ogataea polymorpha]|uniref:uncharacterized protein n=1 Tax=Ogataea polymorpha TaxID=460523 RepID=UPI0007F32EC8|nr:uncharacterized protein OGAPODRAFT_10107 [Ogataea polymorpha]OBA14593.1 hypothetical protein OGAPODRAFT_10107 [Ogataea polymorpha]